MSALGGNTQTITDILKGLDPDGSVAPVIELLLQTNEMLPDIPFMEANGIFSHRTTVRTGLPTVYWRLFNQGVQPSKSSKAQLEEPCGMVEGWSEVDEEVVKISGNPAATRLSEARAFIEAMNQEMQSTVIYGNAGAAPEEFNGLAIRYSSLSAGNAQNIIDMAGTQDSPSDLTSIWLISWGEETVHGIFPKGSVAGLTREDYGVETVETTAGVGGTRMRAYRERFQWKLGIVVRDWRHVVRIANLDISDQKAVNTITTLSPIFNAMSDALARLPNRLGTPRWYVNRTVKALMDRHARGAVQGGGGLSYKNIDGEEVLMYGGYPIRTVDALLGTETAVA